MSSRDAILGRVRAGAQHRTVHPGLYQAPERSASWDDFVEQLRRAGGEAYGPVTSSELGEQLARWVRSWAAGGRVVIGDSARALAPDLEGERVAGQAPHELADVEVAVLCGDHAVAENGSVGVTGREALPRAVAFLCQRLVLLIEVDLLLGDMHQAVQRVSPLRNGDRPYTWICGPSKTADIEQSLVLGAHGPKDLAVIGWRRAG